MGIVTMTRVKNEKGSSERYARETHCASNSL